MMKQNKATGMKSAYELALERLEDQGIERPREGNLGEDARAQIGEVRNKAAAKLAELEILYRDRRAKSADPAARQAAEDDYLRERRRIEADRDRKVEQLRGS